MIRFEGMSCQHYILIAVAIVFIFSRILKNREWVKKYYDYVNLLLFAGMAVILGIEFVTKKIYVGLLAIFLGSLAMGKIYFDKIKCREDKNED